MVAGTQHGGARQPRRLQGQLRQPAATRTIPGPALRALLVDLDQWVKRRPPRRPASRVPTLAAGTLAAPSEIGFPAAAGNCGRPCRQPARALWRLDEARRKQPARAYVAKGSRRSTADGNEVAGLRLPDIVAPLGTYTGWNLYRAPYPEGETVRPRGKPISGFAKTKAGAVGG